MKPKVLGAALGQCVHVAGLDHFLRLCERHGWEAISLGPAVAPSTLLAAIDAEKPHMVAVSFRLTPDDAVPLFDQLRNGASRLLVPRLRWVFGGTTPVAQRARECGLFEQVFDGSESPDTVESFIRGKSKRRTARDFPKTLLDRIEASYPMPILRHHYGEPDLARTVKGARRIAKAEALDVLSIGPDQNAQEHFFRPEEMVAGQDGAGGVPVRTPQDLAAIYKATRTGNYPLVRCYSGTRDLCKWAEMSIAMFNNAWAAIPLCWYSVMDGRSTVALADAIREKQEAMRYYAHRGIPVEVNESHQWSLRDAHDSLAVAMAFLAAYNAKVQGATHYVIQLMHNTPPSTSPAMDLAKMLAKLDLIAELEGPGFTTYREVRAGITSLPYDEDEAKGHMAASAIYAMVLRPHILHVVGYSEAREVVDSKTLIESCRIARGAVHLALRGAPDPVFDPAVQTRKSRLIAEAKVLLDGIRAIDAKSRDPWSDADVLAKAIQMGVLDAPHFRGNPHLCGKIVTACVNGGWEPIDTETREPIGERERLRGLGVAV